MGCCRALSAISRDCESNRGGIRRAWVNCFDTAGKPTVTAGVISALGNATGWVEIEFRKQTGNFITTINADDAAGVRSYSTVITLVLARMSTEKWAAVHDMNLSDLAVIIEDNNGVYWYFGYDEYVFLGDGSTGETGTAFADANQYTLNLNDFSSVPPYEVSETAMAPILSAA